MFGLTTQPEAEERYAVDVPGLDEDWRIGAIVGPSGSGKSSVARAAFGPARVESRPWPEDLAVVEGFGDRPIKEITRALTAVGFSSPPAWLKPYAILSPGERFRCDLARGLLVHEELVMVDEFTSVVDRRTAQLASAAVAKAVRAGRFAPRLVAVTCHADVVPWLQPDWTLDMATRLLARSCLPRPPIHVEVGRCRAAAWSHFARFHYLSSDLSPYAECFLACADEQPVGFCAVLNAIGRHGLKRLSRLVIVPEYQGLGLGGRLANTVAAHFRRAGKRVVLTASHPAVVAFVRKSPCWDVRAIRKSGCRSRRGSKEFSSRSHGRPVVSAEYLGNF